MINLVQEEYGTRPASIKVIGVGGGGGNTINSIIDSGYRDIEFIATNTDAQALSLSKAPTKIQIGIKSTKGLGTGSNPDLGKRSAEEDMDKIMSAIGDADIVFLTAGLGGGTGSGALPTIAHALREKGVLCIAVVTKPFLFEGKKRMRVAEQALEVVKKEVDTLIVIPNQKLLDVVDQHVSMIDAFSLINNVLGLSVKGISDIITKPGHINVDFADVKTIMKDRGLALMGTSRAKGERRAEEAALNAIASPLLENMDIEGARGVLLNVTGGPSLTLHEVAQAAAVIYDQSDEDAHIIIGSVIDEAMGEEVSVTVIATGFHHQEPRSVAAKKDAASQFEEAEPKTTAHVKYEKVEKVTAKQEEPLYAKEYREVPRQQEAPQYTDQALLDINALDIPTFLRQQFKTKEDN